MQVGVGTPAACTQLGVVASGVASHRSLGRRLLRELRQNPRAPLVPTSTGGAFTNQVDDASRSSLLFSELQAPGDP
jgi:hypothetical protein